jgi:hypothetical protein
VGATKTASKEEDRISPSRNLLARKKPTESKNYSDKTVGPPPIFIMMPSRE